ncbi:unnamed protein product [Strongylus vulgaris]|uniref:Uncharacterized protein n=1 Tax=Strongylus vulgaris TaxID=40348 RepID=A0A3P7L7X4_STRVU|nr:unnamed protein product [Strongylus vulgaris]
MMTYGSKHYHYGRSPRQEMLDDMREELMKTKKANAQLALDNRLLTTKLQRLTKEIKIYSGTTPPKNEHAEHAHYHASSSSSQSRSKTPQKKRGRSKQRQRSEKIDENKTQTTVQLIHAETSTEEKTVEESELSNQIRVLHEKNKKKLKVAKAYAEQNRKLKERLKQMREEFHELRKNQSKNPSGSATPSIQLNGLEGQLVDLMSRLESTRILQQSDENVGCLDGSFHPNGQVVNTDLNREEHRNGIASKSSPSADDQVPSDVLLYVIGELATAHNERQSILIKLNAS